METQFMDGAMTENAALIVEYKEIVDALPYVLEALHASQGSAGYEGLSADEVQELGQSALDRLPANFETRTAMAFDLSVPLQIHPTTPLSRMALPNDLKARFASAGIETLGALTVVSDAELTGQHEIPSRFLPLIRRLAPRPS